MEVRLRGPDAYALCIWVELVIALSAFGWSLSLLRVDRVIGLVWNWSGVGVIGLVWDWSGVDRGIGVGAP